MQRPNSVTGTRAFPQLWYGNRTLPIDNKLGHIVLAGTTRAGKTVAIRLMMQSVLPGIHTDRRGDPGLPPNGRAVIYDSKPEFYPIVMGLNLACPVYLLNPFDRRCHAPDLNKDLRRVSKARDFVTRLLQRPGNGQNATFYHNKVVQYLTLILKVLITKYADHWTFRHFLLAAVSELDAEALLNQLPDTRSMLPRFRKPAETWHNICQSIDEHLLPLFEVAACYDHAHRNNRRTSFTQWRRGGESILMLGSHGDYAELLRPLNRALMDIVIPLACDDRPDDLNSDRRFFFLDEWSDFLPTEGFKDILRKGAGQGCHAIAAFQSVNDLFASFGKDRTHAYLDCCHNTAIFAVHDETAEWAARRIGRWEKLKESWSESVAADGKKTKSTNRQYHDEFLMTPTEISKLKGVDEHGMDAVFISATHGRQRVKIPPRQLFDPRMGLCPVAPGVSAFEPRPLGDEELRPFTEAERKLFQLDNGDGAAVTKRTRKTTSQAVVPTTKAAAKGSPKKSWQRDLRNPNDAELC